MGLVSGTRRRIAVVTAMVVGAALLSEPALAQTPLLDTATSQTPPMPASLTEPAAAPVVQAAEPLAQATTPVSTTTAPATQAAEPVQQALEPVVQAAPPAVAQATAPVSEAAAPLTEVVEPTIAQVTEPVLAAAEPVLEQLPGAPVLESAVPVLQVAEPLVPPAAHAASTILSPTTVASSPTGQAGGRPSSEEASVAGSSSTASTDAGVTGTSLAQLGPRDASTPARRAPADVLPSATLGSRAVPPETRPLAGSDRRNVAEAVRPRTPDPGRAPHPLGIAGAISAAFGSSGTLLLLAALAASLFLAAPGAARRLRPALAPWPLPIPLASLERPG